jgi:hypothetical protein
MALLIPLFFAFASAGASVSVHWLSESVLSKNRRDTTQASVQWNLEEISRIGRLSALAEPSWGEDIAQRRGRSYPERVIKELLRQFPDAESKQRCEDIFYIVLLQNGFSANKDFSEPKMTENIKLHIESVAKRLQPDWGNVQNGNKLLVYLFEFEQPSTNRWILLPSLRNLSPVIRNSPLVEQIFQILLFARFYTGTGEESARKSWERLRRIEMSNTGRDSLGMFYGRSIF